MTGPGPLNGIDAVLVIDMQNSFLHPDGGTYAVRGAPMINIPETVANVAALVDAAHQEGVPLVFTRQSHRPRYVDGGLMAAKFDIAATEALLQGTWDVEITEDIEVRDSDHIVDKPRMDAFYNTSMEVLLRGLRAQRLAIVGVVSNACVETTARSAAMRDFDVTVFADCCTTHTDEDQAAAMNSLQRFGFAEVATFVDATATAAR